MEARFRRWASVLLLCLLPASCSTGREGEAELSVRLTYPSAPSARETVPVDPGRGPSYPQNPDNRILVRVLAPHIPTPIEAWFDRSQGQGEIRGVPAGDRIAVEVDEYDNTALSLGTNAPLLGRGWTQGISLSPGERKVVDIPMHDKGTIVRYCGSPPLGGSGVPGDTGDSGLAIDAKIGQPISVKVGPDDSIYFSSGMFNRIRKIDRYGYVSHFAGNGSTGELSDGQPAETAPIGTVFDIHTTNNGKLIFITWDQQLIEISNDKTIKILFNQFKGNYNPFSKPNIAVTDNNDVYFVNRIENALYVLSGDQAISYVFGNIPNQSQEGADRLYYPISSPSSISFNVQARELIFSDTNNKKIKKVNMFDGKVYTLVGSNTELPYIDGIDPLLMTPLFPIICEYNTYNGRYVFAEEGLQNIKYISLDGKIRTLAGTGLVGYSGDDNNALQALLNNPMSLSFDSRGNVYIADTGNHVIRMVVGGALQ